MIKRKQYKRIHHSPGPVRKQRTGRLKSKKIAEVRHVRRRRWAQTAEETRRIIMSDGKYDADIRIFHQETRSHDISAQVRESCDNTNFYPHHSDLLANWAKGPTLLRATSGATAPEFVHTSTLAAARSLWESSPQLQQSGIGVLSFASAKKPGGGFLHGGDEQEECLARATSLFASLSSPAAAAFYAEHRKQSDGSGLHDHAMLYSPQVVAIRDDSGRFVSPFSFSVVSSVPVNAAAVRSKYTIDPSEQQFFEDGIKGAMKERMARILRLFEERGDRMIVLGAFGTGSSENKVETIASIWAELLTCGNAKYKGVFDKVVFAVPGKLFEPFRQAFDMRILEDDIESGLEI